MEMDICAIRKMLDRSLGCAHFTAEFASQTAEHPHAGILQASRDSDSRIKSVTTMEVIVTEELVGKGTSESPSYLERRYWDFDGKLLAIGGPQT